MRRVAAVGALVLLSALAVPAGRAAVPVTPQLDEEIDCLEPAPSQIDMGATPLDGKRATVDVLVLLDGVPLADGVAAVKDAVTAYRPIGIDLRAAYTSVAVPDDGTTIGTDGKPWKTASTTRAMTFAKRAVGGKVPPGTEVVYLLTAKELYLGEDASSEADRSYAVAGLADCIGGVAFAHRAFAIGERLTFGEPNPTLRFAEHLPGKILAHEVGHLLGAHHHYANCAEGIPGAALARSADACTLMFNDVGLVSLRFSSVNRPTVRGHAITHRR